MYAKRNRSRKLIILFVLLALIIGGTIGGTLAWLMAETDPLVNTFTVGDLNITLSEPNFTPNQNDGRYKALPGDVIAKDPTITVDSNSEPCYVRVFVINWWEQATDSHFKGTEAAGWYNFGTFSSNWSRGIAKVDSYEGVKGHITEFRYNGIVNPGQTIYGPFSTITVPEWITGEKYASLDNYKVVLIAQAVQSDGFNAETGSDGNVTRSAADVAFAAAGLPTGNLGLGTGAPATIADMIALHISAENGGSGSENF